MDGISFTVDTGEIYGFLGPNGAGKSTTVLMLTTLLPPSTGRATVGGYDVVADARKVREIIGVALQDVALDEMLTGREHLHFRPPCTNWTERAPRDGPTSCCAATVQRSRWTTRNCSPAVTRPGRRGPPR